MHQPQIEVAAQQLPRIGVDAGENAFGDRADAGDGRDAENEAGDEDAKAPDAAPQLPPCQAPSERRLRHWAAEDCAEGRGVACGDAPWIRPSTSRMLRSQRAASAGSWVISISVAERRSARSNRSSMM